MCRHTPINGVLSTRLLAVYPCPWPTSIWVIAKALLNFTIIACETTIGKISRWCSGVCSKSDRIVAQSERTQWIITATYYVPEWNRVHCDDDSRLDVFSYYLRMISYLISLAESSLSVSCAVNLVRLDAVCDFNFRITETAVQRSSRRSRVFSFIFPPAFAWMGCRTPPVPPGRRSTFSRGPLSFQARTLNNMEWIYSSLSRVR